MKTTTAYFAVMALCTASGCGSAPSGGSDRGPPIGFTFESTAGSFASFGWTGALHDVEEPLGTPFGVKTTDCPTADGLCHFVGPTGSVSKVDRRRCLYRTSKTCNTDGDCPSNGGQPTPCVYIYDTPISTPLPSARASDGHVPIGACAWSYIPIAVAGQPPTISGSLDLASGKLDLENLTILLPLNSSATGSFFGACAECVGDPTPNDGVKGGTCRRTTHLGAANGIVDDGPDIGMPCDTNRYGTIPGFEGSYSMDCSPTVISGPGQPTQFGGGFKSDGFQISISDKSPRCTASGSTGTSSFCGMCQDDSKAACSAERPCKEGIACIGASMPTAQSDSNNVPVAPNACPRGACDWHADTGLGTCTDVPQMGCYPSGNGASIFAPGDAQVDQHLTTIYYAKTATASCIAAGASSEVNQQLGLPGLLFQKRNFKIIPEYAEDQQ